MVRRLLVPSAVGDGSQSVVCPWQRPYVAHRDALLLARLRWCVILTLIGVSMAAAEALLRRPADAQYRYLFDGVVGFWSAVIALLGSHRNARSYARWLAGAFLFVLTICYGAYLFAVSRTAGPIAATAVSVYVLGITILLPWGTLMQAIVALTSFAGYVLEFWFHPETQGVSTLSLVVSAVVVSILGAHLAERSRALAFRRSWQQNELVALSRELAEELAPQDVLDKILAYGMRLLGADGGTISLHDPRRKVFRIEALAGGTAERSSWLLGFEVPEDLGPLRALMLRSSTELPGDEPNSPFVAWLNDGGTAHALLVPLRHGDTPIGMLTLMRRTDARFDAADRLLARGLADHGVLALHTSRLVADLRHANRARSEFLSTMSHELRTPLNVILGYTHMAQDGGLDPQERDHVLDRLEAVGHDLLAMIEDTLDLGRIESGRDELRLEPVALPVLWRELREQCTRLTRPPGVLLDWRDAVPHALLVTDPRKVTVIVRNLVGNALKFTERGSVRVEAEATADVLVVRVRDTGIGIRTEDRDAIFEMFRQGDGSDARRHGGTGLGLYIVRRFVEQLGGQVDLESEVGVGSCFTVTLPARSDLPRLRKAA